MAIDVETIGVAVDSSGVVKGTRDLDRFGKAGTDASRVADGIATSIKGLAAAYIGLNGVRALAGTIDAYTKYTAQLKLATRSQEEYNNALKDVSRIATTAQANISSISVLYARLNNSLRELGINQREVAKIAENVGLALKVSGATAQESASAMLQLSQAFGSGVLRGEEFNAVNEAAPALMRALAESMGVPIGQLRELASEGQITADVLAKAFGDDKLLETYREQAKEVQTISGSLQVLQNEITKSIGILNNGTGASQAFATAVNFASKNVDLLLAALAAVAAFFATKGLIVLITGLTAALATVSAPILAIGAAVTSIVAGYAYFRGEAVKTTEEVKKLNTEIAKTYSGPLSPNFNSTVVAQDIDEIHRKQEEAARKAKEYQDKLQDAINTKKLGQQELYWEREARLMEEKLDGIIKQDKIKAKLEKEEYETKQKYMAQLQKQANANFDEAQAKAKELADEVNKVSDEISRSLTDALYRGFEKGKSFLQNFVDTLKNTFKTLILQPVIKFLVDSSGIAKVIAAIGGSLSGNALAGESGGGITGLFSSVKDIFTSTNGSIVSSIQDLGVYLSSGNGGLGDVLGGFLGENASAISDGFGYLGAAFQLAQGNVGGALGTAVGTFFGGPLGGAIGSFLGGALGGLFGGGLPPRVTESRTGVLRDGTFSAYGASDPGKRKLGMASGLDQLNEVFANNINTLLQGFGINQTISSSALLTKKKNVRARFSYGVGDAGGYGYEQNFGDEASFQDAFNALVENALGQVTVKAIQASELPQSIKQFFNGLTKKEDVAETINTLILLKNQLVDLPPIFNAVRNAMETTAYSTTMEQLKAQFSATQNFVNLFYTEAEKMDITFKQLTTQFDALNLTVPSSKDAFRALVESINVTDEATRNQFNGLLALAPTLAAYFDQLASGIDEVNQALADNLDQNLFSTFADYASARASVANGLTATGFMGDLSVRRSQGDAELANAVKSLVAQQARTDVILAEIADATRRTREINERWNGDGLPETRVI